jgi:hypothetical protein
VGAVAVVIIAALRVVQAGPVAAALAAVGLRTEHPGPQTPAVAVAALPLEVAA